ncbi:MAG: DUF3445 domain-containing protein [Pegethrix bostrychoides GSE-TBD4-15B]|jgi:hypothetical protein|uniref:DUF3445 domain-containing protein n=1 Tax=Pegethrix bostrychoides GSE-TBD4-15B TaxID=2839662 RepID=A0A951P771_9CYAN|nr:DUF3445 domain-containing protein [Pegethrix bostrychoides GSE-TBD4-15B]
MNPEYLPFQDGRWDLKLGLKPLSLETWIDIDEQFGVELQLKQQLLNQRHGEVFVSLPESLSAQQEVLDLLVQHLLHYFPNHYRQRGNILDNLVTGEQWNLTAVEQPLDLAGRLVQEDLCLMQPDAETYCLSAASVCFPSRWDLRSKLGQELTQIHQPVPGYGEKLARPVNSFFARLKPEYPGWRLNWSIVDAPELHLPPQAVPALKPITAANAGQSLWLRIERQTLRRLNSNAVLFTIRTYVHRLDHIIQQQPDATQFAAQLASAVQQIPSDVQVYKSIAPFRAALLGYLAQLD